MLSSNHRHLRKDRLINALSVSLVLLVAAAKNSLEDGAISGHTTKLKQSLFFRYLWFNRKPTERSSEKENKLKILEKKIERERAKVTNTF